MAWRARRGSLLFPWRAPQGVFTDYCETDILNTYHVWPRYELFRGQLSVADYEAGSQALAGYLKEREGSKPHLSRIAPEVTLVTVAGE